MPDAIPNAPEPIAQPTPTGAVTGISTIPAEAAPAAPAHTPNAPEPTARTARLCQRLMRCLELVVARLSRQPSRRWMSSRHLDPVAQHCHARWL